MFHNFRLLNHYFQRFAAPLIRYSKKINAIRDSINASSFIEMGKDLEDTIHNNNNDYKNHCVKNDIFLIKKIAILQLELQTVTQCRFGLATYTTRHVAVPATNTTRHVAIPRKHFSKFSRNFKINNISKKYFSSNPEQY